MNAQKLEVFRRSREIVLREPEKNLARAFERLTALPEDFLSDRHREPPQVREDGKASKSENEVEGETQ